MKKQYLVTIKDEIIEIGRDLCRGDFILGGYFIESVVPIGEDDAVTNAVCADLQRRQQHGLQKYGNSLATNPATLVEKLKHAYEEALDLAQYLKWSIMEFEGSPELRPNPAGNVGLRSIVRRCQGASARPDGSCVACFAAAGAACLSPAAT